MNAVQCIHSSFRTRSKNCWPLTKVLSRSFCRHLLGILANGRGSKVRFSVYIILQPIYRSSHIHAYTHIHIIEKAASWHDVADDDQTLISARPFSSPCSASLPFCPCDGQERRLKFGASSINWSACCVYGYQRCFARRVQRSLNAQRIPSLLVKATPISCRRRQ